MIVIDNEHILIEKLEIEIAHTKHITNTYILKDKNTKKGCVIDPAYNAEMILDNINRLNIKLDKIIITHTHADHIAALCKLQSLTGVKAYIHNLDFDGIWNKDVNEEEIVKVKVEPPKKDDIIKLYDEDVIDIGDTNLEVIHTPGHTKGSIVLFNRENNVLFSGDTIFEKAYGRTDLKTGSHDDMRKSIDKLCDMFDNVKVLPGHGESFNFKDSKRIIRLLFAYKG